MNVKSLKERGQIILKLKLVLLSCFLSISLSGCFNEKADVNLPKGGLPSQVVPAQVGSYALDDVERLIKANRIDLSSAGNSNGDWILNGVKPSNYYYSCGSTPDCKKPQEHISIYIFKDVKARGEGLADFNRQNEKYDMTVPIVWQNANAIVLYWHISPPDKKPFFEEDIRKALNGWNMPEGLQFNEASAVKLILKDHPEFPNPGEVKKIETTAGGPAPGTKLNGELKTAVEKSNDPNSFVVTLTKAWNITVNGKDAKSIWKFKVPSDGKVELISSVEDDKLIHTIK